MASGSIYFADVNKSVSFGSNSAFTLGTGDFTIECWYRSTDFSAGNNYLVDLGSNGTRIQFYSNQIYTNVSPGGNRIIAAAGVGMSTNTWYHLAWVRQGSTFTLYINGTSVGTATNSGSLTDTGCTIGNYGGGGYGWVGYISNFRIVKSAVYTANFTSPNAPLTAITNTVVLTGQSPTTITDASPNAFAPTATATASSTTPFPTIYFDTSLPVTATLTGVAGRPYTADASLSAFIVQSDKIPYTVPFVLGAQNLASFINYGDTSLAATATPTASASISAVANASAPVTATITANSTYTTTFAAPLASTAIITSVGIRNQFVNSNVLAVSASEGFPFTFPIVFSPITVKATKGLVGDASLTITDSPTSPAFTRGQNADASLVETATVTDTVWLSALLNSSQVITATRTESDTRNANVDTTQILGVASPSAEGILGRNIFSDPLGITADISSDAHTDLYADADTPVTADASADSTRNANFFSYDQIITAEPTAEASIVAYAEAEEIQVTISDSPAADRNANVDSDLAAAATIDANIAWDAQGLEATLDTTTDLSAQESAAAVADMFGGEITAEITAEATRNVFCDSDELPLTATINDEDALRNVIVDADLPVETEITAVRSNKVEVEGVTLEVTATLTEPDPIKGRIGFVDLEVTADVAADVTYGQPLDADHTTTADCTAGFSQMQPLDGDLPAEAGHTAAITRHQYTDSETLPTDAAVESSVLFGALADTDLSVEASRDGTITRNHNVFTSLEGTSETTGAVSFDALLDPDLPVTVSSDIDFLRDAIVDADLAVTAGHFVLIYNDAEDESQLFASASSDAEVVRNQYADADLSVTVTIEALEPSRGQNLDADVLGIVTSDTNPLYNQFLDADMPVTNGPGSAVNFDALLDADLVAEPSSFIDFTKGMSLDTLLALLAPTEERLRSDFVTTQEPLTIWGDTELPFAWLARFLYTDQSVSADVLGMIDMQALLDAPLDIPASGTADISGLLSSNFFPFYL